MDHWTEIFIAQLRAHGLEAKAASIAGVSLRKVRERAKTDEEFSTAMEAAAEVASDALETEAQRRAVLGVPKDVYYQGQVVGTELQYSDTLLSQLLKGRRPKVFGDKKQIDLTSTGTINVTVRAFRQDTSGRVIEALASPDILDQLA
jgi:hypothetical protein